MPSASISLKGTHILITSGPTREPWDPVRYLSNHSSGKMGAALAGAALDLGARVTVVSGPVAISYPHGAHVVRVETAREMDREVQRLLGTADAFVACAAVADYRFARPLARKMKKSERKILVPLARNPDILARAAAHRGQGRPVIIGFALETGNLQENAKRKRKAKGADLMIANSPQTFGAARISGFWIEAEGVSPLPSETKARLARRVMVWAGKRMKSAKFGSGK